MLAAESSLSVFRMDAVNQMARIAFLIIRALLNPCTIPFFLLPDLVCSDACFKTDQVDIDVARFATRNKSSKVPHTFCLGKITRPAVIIDKFGNIFMWYLPGFLDKETVVTTFSLLFMNTTVSYMRPFFLGATEFWDGATQRHAR